MKIPLVLGLHFITIILTCNAKDEQPTHHKTSPPEACGPHGVCKCGPTHKYYQVNCRNRTYKVIPRHILPNATKIVLSENALEFIPEDVFANTPNVTLINLTDNSLTTVPAKLFADTVFLKYLLIASNHLEDLPPGLLANAPDLDSINLSSNKLSRIPEDLFKDKHKLTVIILMKNNLHQLSPTMLSSTPNISTLFLGTNRIREIPDGFFNHTPRLDYLSIPKNNITNFTQSTFAGVRSMKYLSFAWNDLSCLPSDAFGGLYLSGSLDLSHNKLKEIPRGLFKTKNRSHTLKMLYLQGNNLTFLRSESFEGLVHLKYVFLNNNNISWMGCDVFKGTNVSYIYLFGNYLRHLSNDSFGNQNITEIHLYENEIRSMSRSALKGMSTKLKLYLNCKNLNHIPWSENFVNMSCVNQDFVPHITFNIHNTKLRLTLEKEGFVCVRHVNWTCSPCPPGSYGNGHGNCDACARGGFYQDKIGMKTCKTCINGTFVNNTNASDFAQCTLCPEGTNQTRLAGYRACFCKANYSRTNRFMGCSLCEDNGVNCSLDYKFLRPGFYWNWSFPRTNITAYAHFVANLQTNSSLYELDSIEYSDLMPYAHDCPNDYSCPNNDSHTVGGLNGSCAKGYRGWMCYQCENNYYRVLNSCRRCPGHWWIIFETIIVCVIVCGALYFLISQSKDKRNTSQSGERSLVDKVSSRLKIVLGFYQVVGELFESLHDINWVGPLSSVGRFLSFRNINVFALFVRPRCLNSNFVFDSKLKFKIALMFPVFVLLTAFLVYIVGKLILVRKFYRNRSELTHHVVKLKSKIYYYILVLLFVAYTPTCVAIFGFYPKACQEFWMYQELNETISLLRSDFDVRCDDKLEAYHTAAYVGTIVYVVMFPLILLYLLYKYCKQSDARRVGNPIEDETNSDERTSLLNHSEKIIIPSWMKFICENYKNRFWYWEVVELARKATQTAFVTLLGWDDSLTILSTIGLSVLFLTLHAKFSPMKSSFEQRLQLFSLTAIFINVLIVGVDIPHEYGELVSTPLILLNLIIIVTITGEMALGVFRFVRNKYFRH